MRRFVFIALAALLLQASSSQAADPALETEEQKTIYALGFAVSQQLSNFALSEEEVKILQTGLLAGLMAKKPAVELTVYGPKIQAFQAERQVLASKNETAAGAKFLKTAAAAKGAVKSDTGVIYRETQGGTGKAPGAEDKVTVHYHGTLRDGTVFDSSVTRGEPASFGLNRVIPCWTEALQKMKVGGKATITCPAETAYGDRGSGRIKPGAALQFDVELISIEN
ncbi:MAG: FKBP-type peptidyl-prolyl cis-trans isomerase [bacterium]|nr:FKBP-type peptidyl-prolyl cis-trans isomerase [bacterium]